MGRLSRGDKISAIGAALLVISLFLPWYEILDTGITGSAFDTMSLIDIILLIIGAGAIVLTVLATQNKLSTDLRPLLAAGGVAAAVLIVFRILDQPGNNDLLSVKFGPFLALVAAIGIAAGPAIARKL